MCIINKHINNILDDNILRNNIIYREHPIIFNIIGRSILLFAESVNLSTLFLSKILT